MLSDCTQSVDDVIVKPVRPACARLEIRTGRARAKCSLAGLTNDVTESYKLSRHFYPFFPIQYFMILHWRLRGIIHYNYNSTAHNAIPKVIELGFASCNNNNIFIKIWGL